MVAGRPADPLAHRDHPFLGIGLMLAAMAVLPFLDVCAKILGREGMPVIEIVWVRMSVGALITLPFAWRAGGARELFSPAPTRLLLRVDQTLARAAG